MKMLQRFIFCSRILHGRDTYHFIKEEKEKYKTKKTTKYKGSDWNRMKKNKTLGFLQQKEYILLYIVRRNLAKNNKRKYGIKWKKYYFLKREYRHYPINLGHTPTTP